MRSGADTMTDDARSMATNKTGKTVTSKKSKSEKKGGGGVKIIGIKHYEEELTELRNKIKKMDKDFGQERKFIQNASLAYAIQYYKTKS